MKPGYVQLARSCQLERSCQLDPSSVASEGRAAATEPTDAGAAGHAARAVAAGEPQAELEERLQECLLEAFASGAEGLMLKQLGGPYEPSKRADHWVKLKRWELGGAGVCGGVGGGEGGDHGPFRGGDGEVSGCAVVLI
jgi:hypothetical protein